MATLVTFSFFLSCIAIVKGPKQKRVFFLSLGLSEKKKKKPFPRVSCTMRSTSDHLASPLLQSRAF